MKQTSFFMKIKNILLVVVCSSVIHSCASIGQPDGGPIDETPPKFLKSSPSPKAINVDNQKIVLEFDEFIKLENVSEKVIVSPPQIQQPEIKPKGKKVQINLLDSLKPNTTYTIDFGDAIVDNNEGNPLGNFSFTFSTGSNIDTLTVSGTLLNASDLEPIKGHLVGLHSNLNDTAFTSLPFERVSITDSRGKFTIRGIAPGKYHLYALKDMDQNFLFSQPGEEIAFHDSIIIPTLEERQKQDTLWKDSLTIDTILTKKYTHYLPDDLILRSFKEDIYNQYLEKSERVTPNKFSLYFKAKSDSLPKIKGINFDTNSLILEANSTKDTLHYWIKDSLVYQMDTLYLAADYFQSDTLFQPILKRDTLRFISKNKPKEVEKTDKKKKKQEEKEIEQWLAIKSSVGSTVEVYDLLSIEVEEPIKQLNEEMFHIREKVDTLWKDISFTLIPDSNNIRRYLIESDWKPQGEYELTIDSLAIQGIYGLFNNTLKQNFKIRALEEYGQVYFNITGLNNSAFVELLDTQDKVIRKVEVKNNRADFYYLMPGKYAARLIVDENKNGRWDTGDFKTRKQPEMVYYYPQLIEFKANWEALQDWDLNAKSLDEQKLEELKKQKPDENKKKKRDREKERSQNSNQRRGGAPMRF